MYLVKCLRVTFIFIYLFFFTQNILGISQKLCNVMVNCTPGNSLAAFLTYVLDGDSPCKCFLLFPGQLFLIRLWRLGSLSFGNYTKCRTRALSDCSLFSCQRALAGSYKALLLLQL